MKKRIVAVILACLMIFSCITVSADKRGETASKYIKGIIELIEVYYKYGDVSKEDMYEAVIDYVMQENPDMLEGAISAATDLLDEHSVYYKKDELASFIENVEQSFVGIGVVVQKTDAGCIATEVMPNGGAFDAGVQVGDEIISVNGESIAALPLNDIVAKIQGIEGTTVTVGIKRNGVEFSLDIVRKQITVQTVFHEIKDDIGYIYISSFASATAEELEEALYDIEENHRLNKIIIDLRDNPGGALSTAKAVSSLFIPKGKIISKMEYRVERFSYDIISTASFTRAPNRKIAILVNENSASASEFFSGAMQGHKLATIIGNTTFGKGSMQEMLMLNNPKGFNLGDVKLTMAEFTKPNGDPINFVGITPDIRVLNTYKDFDESTLSPMTHSDRYTIGDTHPDVLAIEERLDVLGFSVGEVDGVFDKLTHQATINFQAATNLHPYGVMDYTTQNMLEDKIEELEVEVDKQLQKAIEFLNK